MYSMNYIGKFISNFRDFYNEINTATLTGAIDVIVVEQPDGTFSCSPFHVRFGKLGVLRSREKVVDIEINGEPLDIHMKLGESGEAFFVEEVSSDELCDDVPPHLACSPIPTETGFPTHFEAELARHGMQNDEWSRRRCNSDVIKRRPKEILDHKFAQDDIDEHKPSNNDIVYDWNPEFVSAPELGNTLENFPVVVAHIAGPAESTAASVPKTFKAETVSASGDLDQARKLSSVSGEFRPISEDAGSPPSGSEQPAAAKPDELQEDSSKSGATGKRRRRKRSLMKKKGGTPQRKNSEAGEASDTVWESASSVLSNAKPESEPTMFAMDDVDGVQANSSPDTISAESFTSPVDQTKTSTALADEISRDLSKIQNASTEVDFHFFSDTEILPGNHSPDEEDSRPCSPVQSDTEFETTKRPSSAEATGQTASSGSGVQQSWRWGELPSPPPKPSGSSVPMDNVSSDEEVTKQQESAAAQKSMLSGMFSFMKKTKRIRHNPESEGIYLSELNVEDLDPEVAALYFPTSYQRQGCPAPGECTSLQKDEDAESGNGPSLPQSPHSVEGAIGGPKSVDSDFEEPKHSFYDRKPFADISISLCGTLSSPSGPSAESFAQSLISFEDLVHNPKIVEDPNFVVRIDGQYYNWKTGSPHIMSLMAFQRPLPQDALKKLRDEYMPNVQDISQHLSKTNENVSGGRGYSSWFYWRRSSTTIEPKKIVSDPAVSSSDETTVISKASASTILEMPDDSFRDGQAVDRDGRPLLLEIPPVGAEITITQDHSLPDLSKDRLREEGYNGSNSSDSDDARRNKSQSVKIPIERRSYYQSPEKYRKTLRLSSEQIAQLNLQEGTNEVVFSVTTAYQGTTRCKCNIYRWRYDDKIVISDIDGTITKSDVLGHILPIVGKDWAQSGVAQLFTKIQNNGYRLLYLSARAIGQARVTREYLRSIKQDDLSLPDGPLLLSPTSLMSALHREVIERKPEEFKISCLRDIQALFPSHCKPFYAGYGNKINDVWAYRAVGIPIFRIFTINHRGELKHELTQTFQSSYLNMSCIVDEMFPARLEDSSVDYSNFVFWRQPIFDIQVDLNSSRVSTSVPADGASSDTPIKGKK